MKKFYILLACIMPVYGSYLTKIPPSITNLGNLCYMNATLQCLYQIAPLTKFMLTKGASFYKPDTIAMQYVNLVKKIDSATFTAPTELCVPVFRDFFSNRQHAQEDATEFLSQLIERLGQDDVKPSELANAYYLDSDNLVPNTDVNLLFSLITKSAGAGKKEVRKMLTVPLEQDIIASSQEEYYAYKQKHPELVYKTLEECLRSYFTAPDVPKPNIFKAPDYLIIFLLRTVPIRTSPKTIVQIKADQPISFPLYNLSLASYFDQSVAPTNPVYNLASCVLHTGSPTEGHYTALVKDATNTWYFCDDSQILQKSLAQVEQIAHDGQYHSFTPYLLFYQRIYRESPVKKPINITIVQKELAQLEHELHRLQVLINKLK